MTQLTIVYIIIAAVVAVTLYRISVSLLATFKSKKPSKCANCYLKEVCTSRNNPATFCQTINSPLYVKPAKTGKKNHPVYKYNQ
jgi:hypothetical protein